MLMSEPAKARLPGERGKGRWRGEGEKKNLGGRVQSIVEKRGTDGGWCKLWMQPAISKRNGSEEENSSKRIRRLWKWFGASV